MFGLTLNSRIDQNNVEPIDIHTNRKRHGDRERHNDRKRQAEDRGNSSVRGTGCRDSSVSGTGGRDSSVQGTGCRDSSVQGTTLEGSLAAEDRRCVRSVRIQGRRHHCEQRQVSTDGTERSRTTQCDCHPSFLLIKRVGLVVNAVDCTHSRSTRPRTSLSGNCEAHNARRHGH